MGRDWSHDDHEEGGSRERWLVTYADLVTLLLVFFIVMYALSSRISIENFEDLSKSLQASMKKTATPKPGEKPGFLPTDSKETRTFKANATKVIEAVVEANIKSDVKVDVDQRGMVVSLIDTSFFESGAAVLKPEAAPLLKKIAQSFKGLPNTIRVEGHTDNIPINTRQFPSNWELSSARATAVVRFLSKQAGVPEHRMSAVAYADHKPVASNGTWAGRKRNRRVDIIIERSEDGPGAGVGVSAPLTAPVATPAPVRTAAPKPGFYNPFN